MNELQKSLLDILKWFHELCEKENLKYYVLGGTAIGATRHQGFIPWDDDIDVGMHRCDYERFIGLAEKINQQNEKYFIESVDNCKEHIYPYAKIYDTDTTLIENTRYKIKRGIYIDVFPIDNVGDTIEESEKNFKKVDFWVNLLCTRVCALNKNRELHKNLAIIFSRLIPDMMLPSYRLIRKIEKESRRLENRQCEYVANFAGNWHEKEIMKKEWYGEPALYRFEDMQVCGPENIDAYLTRQYGDYMKLPPVEKRVSHHDFKYMDLNSSYKNC